MLTKNKTGVIPMITLMTYFQEQFNKHHQLEKHKLLVLAEGRKGGNQVIFWVDKPDFQNIIGSKITSRKYKMPSAIEGDEAINLSDCTAHNVFDLYPELFLWKYHFMN